MDKIFSSFPLSGFFMILLWISIRFLLIDFSFLKLGIAYFWGFLIWSWVLWKGGRNDYFGFLPISWIICISGIMVFLIWEKLRKPIHEGIFTMNIIIIIYWIIESTHWAHISMYLLWLLVLLFLTAIYQNISSIKIPAWQQFIIILINTIIMSIIGASYIKDILSLWISDINNTSAILKHGMYYFSFWLNILFIAQQFLLIGMLLPQKNRDYSMVFDEAFEEYSKNYSTDTQTNSIGYFLFILFLILSCILNYVFTIIAPLPFIGILFLAGSIFDALFLDEKMNTL